ncbi:MAG TPA: hypothetical protein VGC47_09800 [Acidimicrobiia bacterium]|jgi:DUF4097 and DUF4098 domain-containing protein YvlB
MRKMIKVTTVGALALALLAPTAAWAKADVIKTGDCTAASDWKLKLDNENGQIELEYEVDQNVVGDVWRVKIRHNGDLAYKFKKTTKAPSGSFEARRLLPNEAGKDHFKVRAINLSTGEECVGRASL